MAADTDMERVKFVLLTFATSRSALVVGLYLAMVFLSPHIRRFHQPFQLRRILIGHNFICSVMNLYALIFLLHGLWEAGTVFSIKHIEEGSLRHGLLVYWISKFVELLDTVYMILRHKTRQISFLHVWHHSTITLLADWAYTRSSIPAIVPVVALNSTVHVVMYGYYALTALYPLHEFTWKKRITQMQMTQFVIAIIHGTYGYLYHSFCIYSILYGLGMLSLFSNFYYRAFIAKKKPRADRKATVSDSDDHNSVTTETAKTK